MKHPDARIEAILAALAANAKLPTIELGLERVSRLLDALGNPERQLPPVVHVAGTNGKGSLLAYLTAILKAAGYRVHRYISPHLVRFNERIMLAGEQIDDARLLDLLRRVSAPVQSHPVTFFEATTAAAFLAFCETPADILLLETGLGGRLDATNVVTPALTAITPVSMDHMEYLGDTLAAIAGEKAGIIKQGVPLVTGPQQAQAQEVIERVANNLSAPLYRFGQEWFVEARPESFFYHSPCREGDFPLPVLAGAHQARNAATAIACVDCLKSFTIAPPHIGEGLANASWPARLQHLQNGRLSALLPEGSELWLDGGHNPDAGQALAAWVAAQPKPVHLICGMLRNKDAKGFLKPLAAQARSVRAVPIDDEPLSAEPGVLCAIAREIGMEAYITKDINFAIESIVNKEKNDHIILICGSLYLAGNILLQNSQKA